MAVKFRESHQFPALLGLCLIVFFLSLGGRDIWDIDEGMHAAMAQTMLLTGDWITPLFNGEAFFDKPVLFNWLNAIAFAAFGITEFAARLPAALAGLGCVVVTFLLGRRMFDSATGFVAGAVLATSLELIALSRVVQYDVPFTFFTTLSLYCFVSGVMDEKLRRRFFLGFYAAAALAVLTKGPIGLLVPGMVIGVWIVVTRRWSLIREMQVPFGTVLFLALVTPWFLLMEQANPGYLHYFIVRQHFGNFLGGEGIMVPRHPEPFYYYVPVLLGGMLPWSLLLPQSAWRAFRHRGDDNSGMIMLLLIWLTTIFLFFSAATSKLATYILPLFPAAALLVAHFLRGFMHAPTTAGRRALLAGVGGLAVLLTLFTSYVVIEDPWTYWDFRSGIEWRNFEIFMIVFSGLFVITALLMWMRKYRTSLLSLGTIAPFFIFYILYVLAPAADNWRGSKDIGIALDAALPAGELFRFHGQMLDSAMFYVDRQATMLGTEEELQAYLAADDRVYVIVRTRARMRADAFTGNYHVVRTIGNKAIVSNRSGPLN